MTTGYSLSDTLPKDAGGQKIIGWADISTSQIDFALPTALGARTTSSKIFGALWAGGIVGGSLIQSPTVGNLLMGAYTDGPSAVTIGGAIPIRANQKGAMYVVGATSTVACAVTGSTETVTLASGILYSVMTAACGMIAGAQVGILNGATSIGHVVFSGANETLFIDYGIYGTCFASLKMERRGSVSNPFVTFNYSQVSQSS